MTHKFWTITDEKCRETNSSSTRFPSLEAAINSAKNRITNGSSESVCVMECVKVVKRKETPISVEDVALAPETAEENN